MLNPYLSIGLKFLFLLRTKVFSAFKITPNQFYTYKLWIVYWLPINDVKDLLISSIIFHLYWLLRYSLVKSINVSLERLPLDLYSMWIIF